MTLYDLTLSDPERPLDKVAKRNILWHYQDNISRDTCRPLDSTTS